jgi:hypothetical protein
MDFRWQSNAPVDYLSLQDVSDDSQDRAIMCLMQLHQRMLVAGPMELISGLPSRPINPPAGKPQGFIDDVHAARPTARRQIKQNFGYHVEVSAPPLTEKRPLLKSRFMPAFHKRQQEEREARGRDMHKYRAGHRVPHEEPYNRFYDSRRGEHYYEQHKERRYQDSISSNGTYQDSRYEHDLPTTLHLPHRPEAYADSPTVPHSQMRHRHSVVSSVSSQGAQPDHPEFNPWAEGDAISPLSVIANEIAASNPYRNQLVPDALDPRRHKSESRSTSSSQATSATLSVPLEATDKDDNDSYEQPVSQHGSIPWANDDEESCHSQESGAPYFNYYNSPSPNDLTRYNNIAASHMESPENTEQWVHKHLEQTRLPPNPSYAWMPPRPPYQVTEGAFQPATQAGFPSRPPPPMEHERPFGHTPSPRSPQTTRSMPLHEGPPQSAPPDRPIPVPTPRIPARNPSRPRGISNVSQSASNKNSSVTSTSPQTPSTAPQSPEAQAVHIATQALKQVPLARHNTNTSSFSHVDSVTSGVTAHSQPPVHVLPPSATGNVKLNLPSEDNKFAGFCKGAWRAQIGDSKKTWEERSRPAGMYSKMNTYIKCQKCHFEGRAIKEPGMKKASIDRKIYGSNGIFYRWEYLFKSHIHVDKTNTSTLNSHFGCMFCVAAGKGTPVFAGVSALLAHVQEHRIVQPEGEIVYRMHAIVGRVPATGEDFDIALPLVQF